MKRILSLFVALALALLMAVPDSLADSSAFTVAKALAKPAAPTAAPVLSSPFKVTDKGLEVTWLNPCLITLCTDQIPKADLEELGPADKGSKYIKMTVDMPYTPDNWKEGEIGIVMRGADGEKYTILTRTSSTYDTTGLKTNRLEIIAIVPKEAEFSDLTCVVTVDDETLSYNLGELNKALANGA